MLYLECWRSLLCQDVVLPCGGQTLELTCQAGGRPPPETVWQLQTELGDLAPPLLSDTAGLAGNGSLLLLRHSQSQAGSGPSTDTEINYLSDKLRLESA